MSSETILQSTGALNSIVALGLPLRSTVHRCTVSHGCYVTHCLAGAALSSLLVKVQNTDKTRLHQTVWTKPDLSVETRHLCQLLGGFCPHSSHSKWNHFFQESSMLTGIESCVHIHMPNMEHTVELDQLSQRVEVWKPPVLVLDICQNLFILSCLFFLTIQS